MMDVSDGLLLDALRLGQASGCTVEIDLDSLPLSDAFTASRGSTEAARLFAATGGDDYALLAALPASVAPSMLSLPSGARVTNIGRLACGAPEIRVVSNGRPLALPERLGHEHRPSAAAARDSIAHLAGRA
jgi:thiamine-monophosphate kinase